jgi:hypothetical protein
LQPRHKQAIPRADARYARAASDPSRTLAGTLSKEFRVVRGRAAVSDSLTISGLPLSATG